MDLRQTKPLCLKRPRRFATSSASPNEISIQTKSLKSTENACSKHAGPVVGAAGLKMQLGRFDVSCSFVSGCLFLTLKKQANKMKCKRELNLLVKWRTSGMLCRTIVYSGELLTLGRRGKILNSLSNTRSVCRQSQSCNGGAEKQECINGMSRFYEVLHNYKLVQKYVFPCINTEKTMRWSQQKVHHSYIYGDRLYHWLFGMINAY